MKTMSGILLIRKYLHNGFLFLCEHFLIAEHVSTDSLFYMHIYKCKIPYFKFSISSSSVYSEHPFKPCGPLIKEL